MYPLMSIPRLCYLDPVGLIKRANKQQAQKTLKKQSNQKSKLKQPTLEEYVKWAWLHLGVWLFWNLKNFCQTSDIVTLEYVASSHVSGFSSKVLIGHINVAKITIFKLSSHLNWQPFYNLHFDWSLGDAVLIDTHKLLSLMPTSLSKTKHKQKNIQVRTARRTSQSFGITRIFWTTLSIHIVYSVLTFAVVTW